MHFSFMYPALLAILSLSSTTIARKPGNSVLLSQVKSLTLRSSGKTTHRRVSAIPQLKCVGGNGRGHYEVDVMRCKNSGSDYDDENIQWTCTASLPAEFKLGSTDVICEGYDSPDDPFVLKGSCGVEYRLILTGKGEEKFGKGGVMDGFRSGKLDGSQILFWALFLVVAGWILYSMWASYQGAPGARHPPRNPGLGRGGWGGGGGGGGGDNFDPPPPYPGKPSTRVPPAQQGWRPGFWSGALGGAAAGYMAGNRGARRQEVPNPRGNGWFGGNSGNSWGAGPSTGPTTRSSSGSSVRHESTGFGSTSRR